MSRLNRLVGEVLLGAGAGGWPGLFLDWGVVSALFRMFFAHYYSTGIFRQGLRVGVGILFSHSMVEDIRNVVITIDAGHCYSTGIFRQGLRVGADTSI
jgi:hypothetical protein